MHLCAVLVISAAGTHSGGVIRTQKCSRRFPCTRYPFRFVQEVLWSVQLLGELVVSNTVAIEAGCATSVGH